MSKKIYYLSITLLVLISAIWTTLEISKMEKKCEKVAYNDYNLANPYCEKLSLSSTCYCDEMLCTETSCIIGREIKFTLK